MVLICVAVELERAAVAAELAALPSRQWHLIRTGIGTRAARRATQEALAAHPGAITTVIAAGLAGGLHARWPTAMVLAAEWVVTPDSMARRPCDAALLATAVGLGLPTVGLLTTPVMLAETAQKAHAYRQSGAELADMESAAVAEAAEQARLPFLAVRAVSDSAWQALPPELPGLLDEVGRVSWPQLTWSLVRRPRLAWELTTVAADARRAVAELAAKLRLLLSMIVPDLR